MNGAGVDRCMFLAAADDARNTAKLVGPRRPDAR
jgi:hypothetical protein